MCGVVGLIGSSEAAREAFLGLTTLQHRGQDAAGILTYDSTGFHQVKNLGLAETVFTKENMASLTGQLALGHTRYSTVGRGDASDVQPLLLGYPYGLAMVHNGNIVNHSALTKSLKEESRWNSLTTTDTEILLNLFARGLTEAAPAHLTFDHICNALRPIYETVKGSFSVVSMVADHGLVAFRDPYGIRPLVWGSRQSAEGTEHMVASESLALTFNQYEIVRDLQPGEVLYIDLEGNVHTRQLMNRPLRPCMFEWVYFASAESEIDTTPVYASRIRLGQKLARVVRDRDLDIDLVAAVPDTARTSATALAEELRLPYREVLIKNRYIKRTFILASEDRRRAAINLKMSPVRSEIEGKNVLLVDDSIVRGNTSKKIIELVRRAGARKVYFVSTCPPIKNPCFYGIDFPQQNELIAFDRSHESIEKEIGADAVIYLDQTGLEDALSESATDQFRPCMACLDGDYPSDISEAKEFARLRSADRLAVERGEK